MNYSRHKLYALGEPLGDSVTQKKANGSYVCGGGGSSSSSSSKTQNTDKRLAVQGGTGISSDNSTITVTQNTLDADIVKNALGSVNLATMTTGSVANKALDSNVNVIGKALDAIQLNDASNAEGFGKLLDVTQALMTDAGSKIDALATAQNDLRGSIDQKTIVVLAVTGAVAAVALWRKN